MKFQIGLFLAIGIGLGLISAAAADEPVKATGTHIYGSTETKVSHIEGNVRIIQGSTTLTTDKATIYTDKKQVILEKQVRLVNPDGTVAADYLDYDLRKKDGLFRGNVIMQRKESKQNPKDAKSSRKDPFSLYANELQLNTNTKNFTAIGARFEHRDFQGTANQIVYNDSTEEMVFSGNVYIKRTKEGEEIRGEETKINLKDKSFIVTKNVSVEFEVKDDDNPENDQGGKTAKDGKDAKKAGSRK
jgi:lipopolysaccharide export system protein LptA